MNPVHTVRVQIPRKRSWLVRFFLHPVGRALLVLVILANLVAMGTFVYYYTKFARVIDAKLRGGAFTNTSMLFASPELVMVGDALDAREVVDQLRRSGYGESRNNPMGWYHVRPDAVEVFPGPNSYFGDEPAVLKFDRGKVTQIISLRDQSPLTLYLLEPELVTNLFDRNRIKRRLVRFDEMPRILVHAVISAEDKRFFQHAGFDPLRIAKAAYVDVRENRKAEGASTLSMQLARGLILDDARKTWRRKVEELMVALHLEQRLTKEQIFEHYCNLIPLGRRGSFAIHGFGEASQAFFQKDLKELTLPEAAMLAGLVQRPSFANPVKWPERARTRRNVILWMMRENGYISDREYTDAAATPVKVVGGSIESTDAPYFVDMVNDSLQTDFGEHDFQASGYRVYTTLDMNLQQEASEAIRVGMAEVDSQVRRRQKKGEPDPVLPQAALVALDAQTGEVKAFIGGRDYGQSQLNRGVARRQPGSVFKPFVFAAALNTGLTGSQQPPYTPSTRIEDEPTVFTYDGRTYEPGNHGGHYYGDVTLRQALAKSLNIPTVKLAESVGFGSVVNLARKAGMNIDVRPTPSVALGAYEVTPMEVAGAYTVFTNGGQYVKPGFIKMIRTSRGNKLYEHQPEKRRVLDARVNYMMVNMMEEVLRSGTGAGVRSRGFALPAAGKTGSSRDGWFAGFTSKLICVVWVGYDDNRDIKLEGARSALPIWTEFMKRAHKYRAYRNVSGFGAPSGVVAVELDPESGELATENCPSKRPEVYLSDTQPMEVCRLHGGGTQVSGWETSQLGTPTDGEPLAARPPGTPSMASRAPLPATDASTPARDDGGERRGLFGRIRDIFK